MRGVKRSAKRAQDTHLPITPFVLAKILDVLKGHPSNYTNIMFWEACCLGFFVFLRSGEFTLPSGMSFNPQFHLSPDDLKVDSLDTPTQLFITIKASKMDQAGKGVTLCAQEKRFVLLQPCSPILLYVDSHMACYSCSEMEGHFSNPTSLSCSRKWWRQQA